MSLPLEKVRVLDFTHLLPGELCSTILTDLGCSVVRIESLKPTLNQTFPPIVDGESLYYWSLHRNKSRMALDLKNPKGIEVVHKLIGETDIVLENFRPGVMDRLGVGYETLRKLNERLIYCSISGYGQKSSNAQTAGHDLNFIAETGVLQLSTDAAGRPDLPGMLLADFNSAQYAALGILAALFQRTVTGVGRHLDISMFECTLSSLSLVTTIGLYTGEHPEHSRPGFRGELANYTVYRCRDNRYIAVGSLEPQFWTTFCSRLGKPELGLHVPAPGDDQLRNTIQDVLSTKTLSEWMQIFAGSNCCVSPVNTVSEALQSAAVQESEMITCMQHPTLGSVPQLRTPLPFKENSQRTPARANVGNSSGDLATVEVLKSFGFGETQIADLIEHKVIRSVTETVAAG